MMRFSICGVALMTGVLCMAAETAKPKLTAEEKAARTQEQRERILKATGGMLESKDSFKGLALVYNAQNVIAESNIVRVTTHIASQTLFNFKMKNGSLEGVNGDWKSLKEREGAAMIVVVLNDPKLPSLLLAPDEHWGVVNVARQDEGLQGEEAKARFVPGRVTRQILRAFALLGGAGKKGNQSPSTIQKLNDIDHARESLPVETFQQLCNVLVGQGMTKRTFTSYHRACQEGWAPQPTNDAQKAIWEKVHSIPNKPMKIEFDPATQKGKVTK